MQRTSKQNNSLHLYCRQLASLLNKSGISQSVFFEGMEADYTEEMIKGIFRKYARVMYGEDSTKKLTTGQITALYDELNRHVSKFGISLAWPSEDELRWK